MRAIHGLVVMLAAAGISAAAQAVEGQGLTAPASLSRSTPDGAPAGAALPRWRSRVTLGFSSPGLAFGSTGDDTGGAGRPALASARLLGDYYFARPLALEGRASGFRATSGLIVGPRLGAWAAGGEASSALNIERRSFGLLPPALDTVRTARAVPYFGLGYSDRAATGGWGFSADVGVMALNPSSGLRYGGGRSVDDVLRDLRLAPVLQLGASYAF